MKHGSLFSGIGGFDLAAQWMGWENIFHCEKEPFCQKVLKYYWPDAELFTDITKSDFTKYANSIDILTGGFPCQPYSTAGKRLGKEDERHLWPEMLRAIREISPRWVVGENVRGLTNWNGGVVFDEVQADLEAEGYEIIPFLLPACGVNAPHRRDRIWFIAYAAGYGHSNQPGKSGQKEKEEQRKKQRKERNQIFRQRNGRNTERIVAEGYASNTDTQGLQKRIRSGIREDKNQAGAFQGRKSSRAFAKGDWEQFPTVSPVHDRDDGVSSELDFAAVFENVKYPRQPARAYGKWRNESIKAGGNAIVPQVVFEIFKAIQHYESIC